MPGHPAMPPGTDPAMPPMPPGTDPAMPGTDPAMQLIDPAMQLPGLGGHEPKPVLDCDLAQCWSCCGAVVVSDSYLQGISMLKKHWTTEMPASVGLIILNHRDLRYFAEQDSSSHSRVST